MTLYTLKKKYVWISFLVLISVAVGFYLISNPGLQTWEYNSLDFFFSLRPSPGEDRTSEVAILLIDEKGLEEHFGYVDPIPRKYLSALVDSLHSRQVLIIALDIALLKPSRLVDPHADSLLINSMKTAGNVVGILSIGEDNQGNVSLHEPHPSFMLGLAAIGHAGLDVAAGGGGFPTVRSVRPFLRTAQGTRVPSLSKVVFNLYKGQDHDPILKTNETALPQSTAERQIENAPLLINFSGPPPIWKKDSEDNWIQIKSGTIATFKTSAITEEPSIPRDVLKGKVVFVGLLSEYSLDQFATPYYGLLHGYTLTRGAEIHANAFLTLLHNNPIKRIDETWAIFAFLLLSSIMVFSTLRFNFLIEIASLCVAMILIWGIGYLLFASEDIWFPSVAATLTVVFAYASTSIYEALTERKQSKRITNIFGQYVDHGVVRQLIDNPEMAKTEGVEREVTLLFSDLKGFTTISERLGAEKTVKLMNFYLTEMSDVIQKNRGTIDKFIGDAIMAFWGAPIQDDEAPFLACLSALQMKTRLEAMKQELRRFGDIEVKHRIGINTGPCIIGNIGSARKINYTAIGDAVNLASRLESVNKRYGTSIMISESTYNKVSGRFQIREIETIHVDGRIMPVRIHELMDIGNKVLASDTKKFIDFYNQGLVAYKKQEWDEASAFFSHAQTFLPNEPVCKFFLERIELLKFHPPGPNWDGVFRMGE